jgi:ATP-dependent Clp protease ATP-binding subunit ClpC
MDFTDLQRTARALYGPALALERIFPHRIRRKMEEAFRLLAAFGAALSAVAYASGRFVQVPAGLPVHQIFGASSLVLAAWLLLFMLECFYYSHLYLEKSEAGGSFISFDTAETLRGISPKDITASFFLSDFGQMILLRCGISLETFKQFAKARTSILNVAAFTTHFPADGTTTQDILSAIFDADKPLADFFFSYGVQKKELLGVAEWIANLEEARLAAEHWWSRDNLSRIPGIGQHWSYGNIYNLEKYERYLPPTTLPRYEIHSSYGVDELKEIEAVLAKTRGANAILVGNDEEGKLQIIAHLANLIAEGDVVQRLKHERIVLFDHDLFASKNGTKAAFESEFILILQEAMRAGNIILVFPDLPALIMSATTLGSDLPSLIEPYLSSAELQVVALADTQRYHEIVEKNVLLMQHLEPVLIKEIDTANTIKVLENEIVRFEGGKQGLFFTYQSLEALADCAERYFADAVMPDKAVSLLLEIVPKLQAKKKMVVEKADVMELIETKTGIPVGDVRGDEKDKLLNLEGILHARIIGQDEAVKAISNAVRRARSGIASPDRPMSSFLFLGPTGVGKTETTKALAEVFFGREAQIMRLDMSEYSSADAASKLIGSFESGHTGVLSSMLREHPYGVLLLDEFEKTTKEVMNLFLQILDEGFFSDMSGKKVNARNLIIIATSNAGSDLIWQEVKAGNDVSKIKDKIVDSIIAQGVFKPELLNRFDGVIVFHPLQAEHLRLITKLMLQKLHARLAQKGINLAVNDDLVDFVMKYGTDPKFGARPINRAIQEQVEQIVAKKIIAGSLSSGSQLTLTAAELEQSAR